MQLGNDFLQIFLFTEHFQKNNYCEKIYYLKYHFSWCVKIFVNFDLLAQRLNLSWDLSYPKNIFSSFPKLSTVQVKQISSAFLPIVTKHLNTKFLSFSYRICLLSSSNGFTCTRKIFAPPPPPLFGHRRPWDSVQKVSA